MSQEVTIKHFSFQKSTSEHTSPVKAWCCKSNKGVSVQGAKGSSATQEDVLNPHTKVLVIYISASLYFLYLGSRVGARKITLSPSLLGSHVNFQVAWLLLLGGTRTQLSSAQKASRLSSRLFPNQLVIDQAEGWTMSPWAAAVVPFCRQERTKANMDFWITDREEKRSTWGLLVCSHILYLIAHECSLKAKSLCRSDC